MRQIYKAYDHAFLLERTKLIRLMDKIRERLADHSSATPHDSFEVILAGNRREEMTDIDHVMNLDNSRRHQIQRLLIVSSVSTVSGTRPDHEVHVEFGRPQVGTSSIETKSKDVAISVRSDNAGWADRTLSELEEQVERTWLLYTPALLTLIGILLVVLFLAVLSAVQHDAMRHDRQVFASAMWLQNADLDRVDELVRDKHVLTDQELREIATRQLRNVLVSERPQPAAPNIIRDTLVLVIPMAAIFACILVLITSCYPRAVFLWGDEEKRWPDTLRRRNLMWSLISIILIGGLLANLFYEGVMGLFGRPK